MAKGLGQGVREFRKALKQVEDEVSRQAAPETKDYSEVRSVAGLKGQKEEPLDHKTQKNHR